MNIKPCLTYNPDKTHTTYEERLDKCMCYVLDKKTITDAIMAEAVTCLMYASIYTIPAYLLDKERKVTFEEVCKYCLNIIKFTLHDLLEACGDFILKYNTENIKSVLDDVLFRETCVYIHLDARVILTLFAYYLTRDITILELYKDNSSFEEILLYFEGGPC